MFFGFHKKKNAKNKFLDIVDGISSSVTPACLHKQMVLTGLTVQLSESSNCSFDIIINRSSVLCSVNINNVTTVNITTLDFVLDANDLISVSCSNSHA